LVCFVKKKILAEPFVEMKRARGSIGTGARGVNKGRGVSPGVIMGVSIVKTGTRASGRGEGGLARERGLLRFRFFVVFSKSYLRHEPATAARNGFTHLFECSMMAIFFFLSLFDAGNITHSTGCYLSESERNSSAALDHLSINLIAVSPFNSMRPLVSTLP
jgi:hypothetical protein